MANIQSLRPFKKGFDKRRNMKGRPKCPYSKSKFGVLLKKKINERVPGTNITNYEAILQKIISDARKGKPGACKLIMDYMNEKPKIVKKIIKNLDDLHDDTDEEAMRAIRRFSSIRNK